jgi:hypothetical protein
MDLAREIRLPVCLAFAIATAVVIAIFVQSEARACPPVVHVPPPPPPIEEGPRGRLTVRTTPEARVFIDGRPAGTTPIVGRYLDAGRHDVRLEASCGTTRRTVRVPAGNDVRISIALCRGVPDVEPPPPPSPPRRTSLVEAR